MPRTDTKPDQKPIPKLPNAAQRIEIHKAMVNAANTLPSQLERVHRVYEAGPANGWPSGGGSERRGSATSTSVESAALTGVPTPREDAEDEGKYRTYAEAIAAGDHPRQGWNNPVDPAVFAAEWLARFYSVRDELKWLDDHAHDAAHPGGSNGVCDYCRTALPYAIADTRPDPRNPEVSVHRGCWQDIKDGKDPLWERREKEAAAKKAAAEAKKPKAWA